MAAEQTKSKLMASKKNISTSTLTFQKIPKITNQILPRMPAWGPEHEIGYVVAAGARDAVRIGENDDIVTILVPSKFKRGLRLGDPLLIHDYVEGESFGGVIAEIVCPNMAAEQLETCLFEHFIPTQELIQNYRLEFLEQGILVMLQLFCTLTPDGNKGPVDYCPHPRSSVFRPSTDYILRMFDLPPLSEGVAYGPLMLGRKPFARDHPDGRTEYLPYVMRTNLLFEHEMIVGTTGKGKTVRNKNDLKQFIDQTAGTVIIFDRHGEYECLHEDPVMPEDPNEIQIWDDCNMKPGPVKDFRVFKWSRTPDRNTPSYEMRFTIPFHLIRPEDLQFYLPSLSQQGYVVLPKLVKMFRAEGIQITFVNFYSWLRDTEINQSICDPRTKDAILRRMSNLIEWGVFDAPGIPELTIDHLMRPKGVSVIPVHHIPNVDVATIVVFHVINITSRWKICPEGINKPPVCVIIDEAQNYFPRFVDESKRTYIKRLVSRAKVICREGRKFKLRMQFATQRPEELDPDVLSIVNTISFMGMTPIQVQSLRRHMELPVSPNRLINLPKRHTIIFSKDNTDKPVTVLVPWPLVKHPIRDSKKTVLKE
ncbi:MAG: ATP-binding protein [Candidatus Ranarchaeia archaeon]